MPATESPFDRNRRLPMMVAKTPLGRLIGALAEASHIADGEAVDAYVMLSRAVGEYLSAPMKDSGLYDLDAIQEARRDEREQANARAELAETLLDAERERVQAALRECDRLEAMVGRFQDRCYEARDVLGKAFATASDDLHADADQALRILDGRA